MTVPQAAVLSDFVDDVWGVSLSAPSNAAGSELWDGIQNTSGWTRGIALLTEWLVAPEDLEDDDMPAPPRSLIAQARSWSQFSSQQGWPAPSRIVPTGDGGILLGFSVETSPLEWEIEFSPDGSRERRYFAGARLLRREELDRYQNWLDPFIG